MSDEKRVTFDEMMVGNLIVTHFIVRLLEDAKICDRQAFARMLTPTADGHPETGQPPEGNAYLRILRDTLMQGTPPSLSVIEGGRDAD